MQLSKELAPKGRFFHNLKQHKHMKLEDLKRSPYLLNNVKLGQGQL